jgi:hypothetical protein
MEGLRARRRGRERARGGGPPEQERNVRGDGAGNAAAVDEPSNGRTSGEEPQRPRSERVGAGGPA